MAASSACTKASSAAASMAAAPTAAASASNSSSSPLQPPPPLRLTKAQCKLHAKNYRLPLLLIERDARTVSLDTLESVSDVPLSRLPSPLQSEWLAVAVVDDTDDNNVLFLGAHRIVPLLLQIDPSSHKHFPASATFTVHRRDCLPDLDALKCSSQLTSSPANPHTPTTPVNLDQLKKRIEQRFQQYTAPDDRCLVTTAREQDRDAWSFLAVAALVKAKAKHAGIALSAWLKGEMAIFHYRLCRAPIAMEYIDIDILDAPLLLNTLLPLSRFFFEENHSKKSIKHPHLVFPHAPGIMRVYSSPMLLAWAGPAHHEAQLRAFIASHPFPAALMQHESVRDTLAPGIDLKLRRLFFSTFLAKEEEKKRLKQRREANESPAVKDIEELRFCMPDCMRTVAMRAFDGKGHHLKHEERMRFYRPVLQMGIDVEDLIESTTKRFNGVDREKGDDHAHAIRMLHKEYKKDRTTDYTSCKTMQGAGLCGHLSGKEGTARKARVACYQHQTGLLDGVPDKSKVHKDAATGEVVLKNGQPEYTWFSSPLDFMKRTKTIKTQRGTAGQAPLAPVFHASASASSAAAAASAAPAKRKYTDIEMEIDS